MQHSDLLPHLSDPTQNGSDFFADERFTLSLALGADHPSGNTHQTKQRHRDEELALHAASSNAGALVITTTSLPLGHKLRVYSMAKDCT